MSAESDKTPVAAQTLRNRLKVARAERNLSQDQLAQKVGVTRQTIIALEAGKSSPSLELAFRIARAFGVGIDEVFRWKTE